MAAVPTYSEALGTENCVTNNVTYPLQAVALTWKWVDFFPNACGQWAPDPYYICDACLAPIAVASLGRANGSRVEER